MRTIRHVSSSNGTVVETTTLGRKRDIGIGVPPDDEIRRLSSERDAVPAKRIGKPSLSAVCGTVPSDRKPLRGKYKGFGVRELRFGEGRKAKRRRGPWMDCLGGRLLFVGACEARSESTSGRLLVILVGGVLLSLSISPRSG